MADSEPSRMEKGPYSDRRIFKIAFYGPRSMNTTNQNSSPTMDEIVRDQYKAIVFDYTQATFGHNIHEFKAISKIWCERIPKGTIFAYIFGPDNLTDAMLMSRLKNEGGMVAGAFPNENAALRFIKDRLGTLVES